MAIFTKSGLSRNVVGFLRMDCSHHCRRSTELNVTVQLSFPEPAVVFFPESVLLVDYLDVLFAQSIEPYPNCKQRYQGCDGLDN
jgi:hypothetical protein